MAKLTIVFDDGRIKKTLLFRGLEFHITWGKWRKGERKANGKGFEVQIPAAFPEFEPNPGDTNDVIEAAEILGFGDEEEIEEALKVLSDYEK